MDLNKYRKNAQEFLSKLDKEYYLHFSGKKKDLNSEGIHKQYRWLFSKEYYDSFSKLKKESRKDNNKNAYLLKFCAEGLVEKDSMQIRDRIAKKEAECRVNIDGSKVPFRYVDVLLANESRKKKRDLIEEQRNKKISSVLNDDLYEYWNTLHREAKLLGFGSYRDLFSYLKDEDFTATEKSMDELLKETQDLYEDKFNKVLVDNIGLLLDEARRSDFAYLKRGKKYDGYFRKQYLIEGFSQTLYQLGIDINRQKNIIFDVEERENKSPRAFCCTVRIPQEIYLVVMPSGGQDDYEAVFHEGGHAEHFAHTRPILDFEYKFLGDNAVTEGYAFCMENLLNDMEWLVNFIGMDNETARNFKHFSNMLKLWYCRRYAGKLKYELILHDGKPIDGKEEKYREILSSVGLMDYPKESYLKDVDEGFYCTNYIRAWIFEAQLKNYIKRKFGGKWFLKKEAGNFLKELWSYGQKFDAEDMIKQLGYKGLDIGYLIDSLMEGN